MDPNHWHRPNVAIVMAASFLLWADCCLVYDGRPTVQAADVSFNRDIKPLLAEYCFACHGPDEGQREGGFRLDLRASAVDSADSGDAPIVAGDASSSEVIARLKSDDADMRMPPADFGKQLSPEQVSAIEKWIEAGAEYEQHWAFAAPVRPQVPSAGSDWALNPIDRFIYARLQQEGLEPSPEADRSTLLRRVSLDLTGLPPTSQQIRQFLNDRSTNAYERLVDRLLASPHYGERMALPWLDQARYADSNGYQSDGSREMWPWRDWVIDAFNKNMPYDQFTVEQLAGDMLPNASTEQIVATGFNRNHRLNGEGGRIVEEWFVETVIDRVETTGLTWLGLTLNCCRCHDHKYDPISQQEFYQLFAYFNSNDESGVLAPNGKNGDNTPPVIELPTQAQLFEEARLEQNIEQLEADLRQAQAQLPELAAAWAQQSRQRRQSENAASTQDSAWRLLKVSSAASQKGAELQRQPDGSYLATGKNPGNDLYEIKGDVSGAISGLLLEVFPDERLPSKSLGRGSNGNFVLTGIEARIDTSSQNKPIKLFLKTATADFEQSGWTAQSILGDNPRPGKLGKNRKGWAIEGLKPKNRVPRRLMLLSDRPLQLPKDATLTILMRHDSPFADHNVGRFRWSTTADAPETAKLFSGGLPGHVAEAIDKASEDRDEADNETIQEYFRTAVPNPITELQSQLETQKAALTKHRNSYTSTMVMRETEPRQAVVLMRGEYDKPGKPVERGLPAMFAAASQPKDRLELARWIVDPANPLTARVWVNRTWARLFGTGLVKTTENMGTQAEFPSHPELLDWLAVEFMQPTTAPDPSGRTPLAWDMKALQKLIVMSATYRQASQVSEQLLERDPGNRLLARGPRFRLPGELIRDSALAAGGLLARRIGGPSTRPYMPEGVWDETSKYGNLRGYKHELGEGLHRRTMYTIWKRTAAPPTLLLFDAPNRETCTVSRSKTNTPLQALSLLNEVTFVEAARGLATRMLREGGDTVTSRLEHGFQLALARQPTEQELAVLSAGVATDITNFENNPAAAKNLIDFGDAKVGEDTAPGQLAAYMLAANVILNLDEFVTRE